MSYRNTFVTSFIYSSPECEEVKKIFERWIGGFLVNRVDERGYGFYAGMFKGLYPAEFENDLKQIIPELKKATRVPFILTVIPEDGPVLVYNIRPDL